MRRRTCRRWLFTRLFTFLELILIYFFFLYLWLFFCNLSLWSWLLLFLWPNHSLRCLFWRFEFLASSKRRVKYLLALILSFYSWLFIFINISLLNIFSLDFLNASLWQLRYMIQWISLVLLHFLSTTFLCWRDILRTYRLLGNSEHFLSMSLQFRLINEINRSLFKSDLLLVVFLISISIVIAFTKEVSPLLWLTQQFLSTGLVIIKLNFFNFISLRVDRALHRIFKVWSSKLICWSVYGSGCLSWLCIWLKIALWHMGYALILLIIYLWDFICSHRKIWLNFHQSFHS